MTCPTIVGFNVAGQIRKPSDRSHHQRLGVEKKPDGAAPLIERSLSSPSRKNYRSALSESLNSSGSESDQLPTRQSLPINNNNNPEKKHRRPHQHEKKQPWQNLVSLWEEQKEAKKQKEKQEAESEQKLQSENSKHRTEKASETETVQSPVEYLFKMDLK